MNIAPANRSLCESEYPPPAARRGAEGDQGPAAPDASAFWFVDVLRQRVAGKRSLRVMVADDDRSVRHALVDLLGDDARIQIVGAVPSAAAAVELARAAQPDIAVLDVQMPGGGVQATVDIGLSSPHTQVIGLSSFDDQARSSAMIEAGAVRYLVKGDRSVDLLGTIFEVARRGGWTEDEPITH